MAYIFGFLCLCLEKVGQIFRCDYIDISVYICIHLWPILCVLAALGMLGVAIATGSVWWIVACSIYFLVLAFGYWAVVKHYYIKVRGRRLNNEQIFEKCQNDLEVLAKEWGTTYAVVNLVFYILLFAAIMVFDFCLLKLMLPLV